jgi:hypothetical protein
MPGYLAHYGAGEERRIKIVKTVVISLVSVILISGILFFLFHNYREEQRVKQFLSLLSAKNYKTAYAMFGCTDAKPCTAYAFDKFMEDWGPASSHKSFDNARIKRSRSCGSGVILTIDFGPNQQEMLWVERKDMSIGYPPYQGCPANM